VGGPAKKQQPRVASQRCRIQLVRKHRHKMRHTAARRALDVANAAFVNEQRSLRRRRSFRHCTPGGLTAAAGFAVAGLRAETPPSACKRRPNVAQSVTPNPYYPLAQIYELHDAREILNIQKKCAVANAAKAVASHIKIRRQSLASGRQSSPMAKFRPLKQLRQAG